MYECEACRTSFSVGSCSLSQIYETIYTQADVVAGYDRYTKYRDAVLESQQPADVLISSEEIYSALFDNLDKLNPDRRKIILEIGSGLGYTSHALRSLGHKVEGLDISMAAIREANASFGQYYTHGSIDDILESKKKYDIVYASELIEHVEDIKSFLQKAVSLLSDGGSLLLTTPNKNFSNKSVVWATDLPSVHLWWFSKKTFITLAGRLDLEVNFPDTRQHTCIDRVLMVRVLGLHGMNMSPRLDRNGKAIKIGKQRRLKVF